MRNKEIEESIGFVCSNCNEDTFYFNTKNKELPSKKTCIVCSEASLNGILIEDFIFTLNRHVKNHYQLSDSKSCETLSLEQVLARFTIDEKAFLEVLSKLLCEENENFFKLDGAYKSRIDQAFIKECKDQAKKEWNTISKELKHTCRFTHKEAPRFFENLISTCTYYVQPKDYLEPDKHEFNSAERVMKKGTVLYRGRRAANEEEQKKFISDPNKHLGAPPSHLAQNNRMSPPGISFMYTACNPKTAIAEIRPYVGDTIAVGSFTTQKELTFFDFTLLDSVELKEANILTDPKSDKYYQNGYLLHTLHELISKPFRETSLNYIETQMFAEIIRNYKNGMFDGLIFKSSQHEGGINCVIFGDESEEHNNYTEYNVKINTSDDVTLYQIRSMTPSIKKICP